MFHKIQAVSRLLRPGRGGCLRDIASPSYEPINDQLPNTFPASASLRPEQTVDGGEPPALKAVLTFRWHRDGHADTVVFHLRMGGADQPDDDKCSLD